MKRSTNQTRTHFSAAAAILRQMQDTDHAPQTSTYIGVLVIEAVIIVFLWALGRAF